MSEPMGRGGAWTEERGTSDEGRHHLEAAQAASGKHGTSDEGRHRLEAPQRRAGDAAAAAELRRRIASQFGRSLHVRTLDTGSCAACEQEIRLLAAPHYDLHRLGFFFTPAPRHADLLLVTGPMLRAFAAAAGKTYDAMPAPKIVVATGACALGGVYQPDAFCYGSAGEVLPVDVWIPGCPPSPLALLHGLLVAVDRLAERVAGLSFTVGGTS